MYKGEKKIPLRLLLWFTEPLTVDISVLFEKPCLKGAGTSYFSSWVCDITLRSVFTQNRWRGREDCLSDETLWDCGDGQIRSTYSVGEKIFSSAISIIPWELIRAVPRVMSQRTKCCSSLNWNNSAFVRCFDPYYTMDVFFFFFRFIYFFVFWTGHAVIEQITYIISVKVAQGEEDLLLLLGNLLFSNNSTSGCDLFLLNSTVCPKITILYVFLFLLEEYFALGYSSI